ncbi:MAG: tetratricopeptide repeat protein [Anaerolineae bacterium]
MPTRLSILCDRVIEAGWLATIVLVPLWFNIYSARTFEPDKITLMRSIAIVMVLAWLIKVAEQGFGRMRFSQPASEAEVADSPAWVQRLFRVPLLLPLLLVIFAYTVSTALSISPTVAIWGSYQRLQGTYTAVSYMVIFALVASHLRTRAQLDRLMTTIILTSLPVGLYGIIQRYGLDPLPWAGDVQTRVASTLGNAIFLASYLIMAIPPALSRMLNAMRAILRAENFSWGNTILTAVYIFILAVDVIAVIFSGSRGPMLGLMAGIFFFILLALLFVYRQHAAEEKPLLKALVSSAGEVLVLLSLGCLAGVAAFAVLGPVTVGEVRLDYGAMLALGMLGGVALNILAIVVQIILTRHTWRLWLNWTILALVMVAILVTINISGSPLNQVREVPTVGRLAQLFQPGEGTGRVRALIWEGVLNLITLDEPLGIPGEFTDSLHRIRPLIGYGPESMFNAFARVYPPELAHVEARGSSADRSHNETFDFLAMLGFLGFIAYYWLIFSLFYYLLKAVGWVPDRAAGRWLLVLIGLGGLIGVITPRLVAGNFVFSAVGLPAGMIGMMFVFLVWQAFLRRTTLFTLSIQPSSILPQLSQEHPFAGPRLEVSQTTQILPVQAQMDIAGQYVVLIGVLAALLAHFVEVHFVFSIAATYVYFWVYAGVVVAWLSGKLQDSSAVAVSGTFSEARAGLTSSLGSSRRHKKRTRPRGEATASDLHSPVRPIVTEEDWGTWLGAFGLVVALILMAMIFDFVTAQSDLARNNFSLVWMFAITWLVALAIGLGEVITRLQVWQTPVRIGRALVLFVATSLGYSAFYLIIHRWQLHPRAVSSIGTLQSAFQSAGVAIWLYISFYLFVILVIVLIALMLAAPWWSQRRAWQPANWWLYPLLIIAGGAAILFKNVDVVRADMVLKQAEQYRNQGLHEPAIALHQWAVDLDSDEDFYYLMLALAYQLQGQDTRLSPEIRARSWQTGEQIALRAREINPYNPDNTGNLGRWYLTWAQNTPVEDPQRQARFDRAIEYFQKATYLAPQNVIYYNLWAQVYYMLGRYQDAETILAKSAAIDPKFEQTQMLLGDTYGALGRAEEAARAHRAAILIAPESFADQFFKQRVAFYKAHPAQLQEIIAAYQEALTQHPDDPEILRILGHLYSQLGDRNNALRFYQRAIQVDPADAQTVIDLGDEYVAMGDWASAAESYRRALYIDPQNARAHSNLAYCYARMGRLEEAIQENQIVLQIAPDDYISRRNLVLLYRDTGRIEQAIQEAQPLPGQTPQKELGPTWMLLGELYQTAGRVDEAIAAYEKAIEAQPDLSGAYAALGALYFEQARLQDALRIYQQLVQLTPDDYVVHRQLALVYRELGQRDRALEEAQIALRKAPMEQRADLERLVTDLQALGEGSSP